MAFMLCGSSKNHHMSMDTITDIKPARNAQIPEMNQDVDGLDAISLCIARGRKGFGFTITGSFPVRVGQVKEGTPASDVGLCKDDCIVRINGQNVSRSTADSVAKLIRTCETVLQLVLYREYSRPSACSTPVPIRDENKAPWSNQQAYINDENMAPKVHYHQQPQYINTENRVPKIHQNAVQQQQQSQHLSDAAPLRSLAPRPPKRLTPPIGHTGHSTKSPEEVHERRKSCRMSRVLTTLTMSYQDLTIHEQERQCAIAHLRNSHERLMKQLNFGLHRYYLPLQDSVISPADHRTLFQNIEQLSTFAQHLLHKFCEHAVPFSDNPSLDFLDNVGALYTPILPDICDGIEAYCAGAKSAIRLLQALRKDVDFENNIRQQQMDGDVISIGSFLQKPIEWMKDSLVHLQEVFSHTQPEHHDYEQLREVIEGLRQTCSAMTQSHTKRCRSTFSLISTASQLSVLSHRTNTSSNSGHSAFQDNESVCTLETIKSGHSSQSESSRHSSHSGHSACSMHSQRSNNSRHSVHSHHSACSHQSRHSQDSGISHSHASKHSHMDQSNPTTQTSQSDCGYNSPMDHSEEAGAHAPHCGYSQFMLKQKTESVVSGPTISSEHLPPSLQGTGEVEVAAIDSEVLDIQNRLIFGGDIQSFKIASATRHMIYAGEQFFMDGEGRWSKVYLVLLSDLLLVTRVERDNYLTVLEEPIVLQDINAVNWNCGHVTEFQLSIACNDCAADSHDHGCRTTFTLRAMTVEQKHTWQNIVEQRIQACRTQQQRDEQLGRVIGTFI